MNQQASMSQSHGSQGWSGLASSLMRMASASTVFGIQQIQNSFELLTDSRKVIGEFRRSLDALSDAMMEGVDASKQDTAEKITATTERIMHTAAKAASGEEHSGSWHSDEGIYSGRKR